MKFLVLALCVCAASAASLNQPWQYQNSQAQRFGQSQAFAKAVVGPQVVQQPAVVQIVEQPAVSAVGVAPVFNAPVAVAKSAVYSSGSGVGAVAKNVYANKDSAAAILRADSDVAADGYNFSYETENGIAAQSSGVLKDVGDAKALVMKGSYQYIDNEGNTVVLSYVADENGYQPKSDILPVGPAIPEEIARSLEYIRANPAKPDVYNN